jgi:hypothetical protein
MRIRLLWLMAFAMIAILCSGCSDDNNNGSIVFGGSDSFIQSFYIGDVPVKEGQTVNIPLSHVSILRFDLAKPITPANVSSGLDFSIQIENVDKGNTTVITESVMSENGDLVWVDAGNMTVEFRMSHMMNYVTVGGVNRYLGSVGDRFRFRIQFLRGNAADGKPFTFTSDEFSVVWTQSSSGPLE